MSDLELVQKAEEPMRKKGYKIICWKDGIFTVDVGHNAPSIYTRLGLQQFIDQYSDPKVVSFPKWRTRR